MPTKIEWVDETLNPVVGCNHGCPYCYARGIHKRNLRRETDLHAFDDPRPHLDRLARVYKWRKPRRVFIGSMTDLMGAWIPLEWIMETLRVIEENPRHTFCLLTKNPERYREFDFPPNAWLGATATNQATADRALRALEPFRGRRVRYLSCEPFHAPIRLLSDVPEWLLIGGESGRKPWHPPKEWVETLTADARRGGAVVFYKDNLGHYEDRPRECPEGVAEGVR